MPKADRLQQVKKAISLILMLILITFTHAQINFGVKGGMNISSLHFISNGSADSRVAFNAGAVTQFQLAANWRLQPELIYSGKGSKHSNGGKECLEYLSLPVLAAYSPVKNLSFLAGPEFGYLLTAKSKLGGNTVTNTDFYKRFDFGLDAGVAYNFTRCFGAEIRYCYGLTSLIDVIITDESGGNDERIKTGNNRSFQVGIYYLFKK